MQNLPDNHFLSFHNYKIVKSNKLIEAKSDYSALQQRIILLALVQIRPTDASLKMYKINIRDVLGTNHSSHYEYVREAVERLHQSVIKIETQKEWTTYSFITKAHGRIGQNYIEIQFHQDIQEFLLGLKSHYTSYVLGNVIKFKKNYSLRIYELCKQYEKIGKREFEIDYLKNILSLDEKYHSFAAFKRYVIDPSLAEINQFSDLFLSYDAMKDGRKTARIIFDIQHNQCAIEHDIQAADILREKLEKIGFSKKEIILLNKEYDQDYMHEKINILDGQIEKIKSPLAWMKKALLENFTMPQEYQSYVKKQKNNNDIQKKLRMEIQEIQEKSENLMLLIHRLDSCGFSTVERNFIYKDACCEDVIAEYKKEYARMQDELKEKKNALEPTQPWLLQE
ncbi:MAG: replication initiation protein [Spirochaetia bacterium]